MAIKITNRVMTQESRFKGELRRFEIYNEKFIKVNIHNIFGDQSYHINMDILEPWPSRHRRISRPWLFSLIYFALATLIYIGYLYRHPEQQTLIQLLPFIFLFILLTLASLLMFLYKSPSVLEFRSRYGGCVVLSLLNNKPSKDEFKHFSDELKTRVLAASQAVTIDKEQMLDIELAELQRLAAQGVLTENACQRARERVSNMHFSTAVSD